MKSAVDSQIRAVRGARPRGISIREGSVRQARFEAGLSLAAVAGQELTRAAIHLIEIGKARPSQTSLRLIAERTGKPVTYFLDEAALSSGQRPQSSGLVELVESLVDQGHHQQAVAHAASLATADLEPADRARVGLSLGIAYGKLRRIKEARLSLRQAKATFESVQDSWMVTECLDWEAYVLHLEQHPQALEQAEEALARCRNLDPIPSRTEARILSHLGAIHLQLHNWSEATRVLHSALEASSALKDLASMAAINHDLAIALASSGQHNEALVRAHKALSLYSLLRDTAAMAAAENDLGLMFLLQGDIAGADRHFRASIAHYEDGGIEARKSHTLLSIAEMHLQRGSDYEGEQAARDAIDLAERLGEDRNSAVGHQYLGQIAARRGRDDAADQEFKIALDLLATQEAAQRLVECRMAYADVLEARGDMGRANEQLRAALGERQPEKRRAREAQSATA